MITFNENDLKSYLKKKTGYEVHSIYTIDDKPTSKQNFKIYGNEQTMKVVAYCDAAKTPQYKDLTLKTFLWTETINVADFIKFIRSKKLKQINTLKQN